MAWPLIRHLPERTNFTFVKFARFAAAFSIIATLGSLALILAPAAMGKQIGFNLGIDFKGGTLLELTASRPVNTENLRATVSALDLGDVQVQGFKDSPNQASIRYEAPEDNDPGATVDKVKQALRASDPEMKFPKVEVVGPKVSDELMFGGVAALGGAIVLMLIYIWFRFQWRFGLGAVIALFHDVILTMGLFAVTKMEFTLTIIAALLTIIGYSMNDTVVVFDRLRENLRKYKKMPLAEVIDLSINETLSRTIVTGMTALLALLGMLFIGGEALSGFSIAMIFGIIIGTYSSVYVAAPVILLWGVDRGEEDLQIIPPKGKSQEPVLP